MRFPAPAMNLASRRAAGERPPRGAYGGRSRLCGRILWRRLPGWMRYLPAAVVVDSYGVTAGSADSSPLARAWVFLLGGDGRMLRAYRDAVTSSRAASWARLETPSLA
jgi:hypothetical protein